MEALSMLKYWRGGGGGRGGGSGFTGAIKAAVVREVEDDEEEEENGDEGPFFDLEFAVPDEEEEVEEEEMDGDEREVEVEEEDMDGDEREVEEEEEFDFAVSSGRSSGDGGGGGGRDVSLSPSDDLFFKGRLVPLEPAVFSGAGEPGNSKPAAQFPAVSFLKSATKFRVFLLGLKKPRPPPATTAAKAQEQPASSPAAAKSPAAGQQGKLFTVKFKVEEVPIVSLFTRDNSSKGSFKPGKAAGGGTPSPADVDGVSDAKRLLGKYLKMIKPLYVRVSRRYAEKLKLEQAAGQKQPPPPPLPSSSSPPPPAAATGTKSNSNGSLPAGLRVVCKHLGKSRSSSSVAVLPAGAVANGVAGGQMSSQRQDDSLLQQQDGIQSAILHCKRSLNASSPKGDQRPQLSSNISSS